MRSVTQSCAVSAVALWLCSTVAVAEHYTVPLFVPVTTSNAAQGVLRILNDGDASGTVTVYAIDDTGTRSGPVMFTLGARAAVELTATELANGSAARGLTGSLGTGTGNWRLEIETDLAIQPLAYVRGADGTLAVMHDTVRGTEVAGVSTYHVPIFNPSSNVTQASRIRLINPGDAVATVTIGGRDDTGAAASGGEVQLTIPASGARTLTAQQLEAGDASVTGRLGAGVGRWRLSVSADRPIQVVNVAVTTAGVWNNLSTTAVRGPAPANHGAFNERFYGLSVVYETDGGRFTLSAQAGDGFTETGEADGLAVSRSGGYSYTAIGPDAGRLMLEYDDGNACAANFYFASRTGGWFASHCTGSDDPDGYWIGGNWFVEEDEDGGAFVETAYEVNDALPGVPTSGAFAPAVTSGASVTATAEGTTIALDNGGYFELSDGTRYTCTVVGGCTIVNGTVTAGTVTGREPGAAEVDRFPSFRTAAAPGNQSYTVGTAIDALTLPAASGGNGDLTYTLSPVVPNLTFNASTRQLTGTPTTAASYIMTYTVTDEDGDTDSLGFAITVSADTSTDGSLGVCQAGMLLRSGQTCTYPDTDDAFSVNERDRGVFLTYVVRVRIRIENQMIDGRVYDFEASHQGDGVWRIDRVAGSTEVPATGGANGSMDEDGVSDADYEQVVPLLFSASNQIQQGFVRVVNRSPRAGSVTVMAIDDSGRAFGPVQLAIGTGAAVDFNARDLEQGNPSKGLSRGVGGGQGDWRLALRTELDVQATSYVYTADGFVAPLQALARKTVTNGHHSGYHVPTFDPGSGGSPLSTLRLINTSNQRREVTISGIDEQGTFAPGGTVRAVLEAHESRYVTSWELEHGAADLHGALGDGQGMWRLLLSADPEVLVMSLLENSTGHLANLSRGGSGDSLNVDDPEVQGRHSVPWFVSASNGVREGFVRIINHSKLAGEVSVRAIDDLGQLFEPVKIALAGMASFHFNSEDLEAGNPGKGLSLGVGESQGDWRLELVSELPIEVLAYIRTADGFLTNVQDVAHKDGDVPMFSPGSDTLQQSSLRLVNTLDRAVEVTIEGMDDRGEPGPGGVVRLRLAAGEAHTLTARQLEIGGEGQRGRLGDGTGRWRLAVSAPQGVLIMSLLESSTGYLSNVSGGVHAEPLSRDTDSDGISDYDDAFPKDASRQQPINGISTTLHDQIVVQLQEEDTAPASLFDLNGKTLRFQRLAGSGYTRSVEPLAWEPDIGSRVGEEAVQFQTFAFPFAESRWDAFHVNVNGNITFGEALGRPPREQRFSELRRLGDAFTKGISTIAAYYKPHATGSRYVNRLGDRVVVTWKVAESWSGVQGFSLSPTINEFQAVLFADGSIAFNYRDVLLHDGIVGLFPLTEPARRNRLATLYDSMNPDLPAYLDLTQVSVFDTDSDSLIVEFVTRGALPDIGDSEAGNLHYTLYLDIDEPLADRIDFNDADYTWRISGDSEHRFTVHGEGVQGVRIDRDNAPDRVSLLVSIPGFEGGAVAAFADAFESMNGRTVQFDQASPDVFVLPAFAERELDLSMDGVQSPVGYEAFHFRGRTDRFDLTCRVIQSLGDGFDFIFYHAEYRSDQQEAGSPMARLEGRIAQGLGIRGGYSPARFCTEGKLLGILNIPIYMNSNQGRGFGPTGSSSDFNFALSQLGHEMGHAWTVGAAYRRDGQRVPLNDDACRCHWRWELHVPVAFPWQQSKYSSTMGGGYWEDNLDGTYTRVHNGYFVPASGFSYLDLYLMGLFAANEVPDTWLLQDPKLLKADEGFPVYSGQKEVISIDKVIAALGPRIPAAADSQATFNVGFVYLAEPGRSPTSLPLQRHAAMRDKFVEYWTHVTGDRSQITTDVLFDSAVGFGRSPMEIGSNVPQPLQLLP